jgi:MHS family citrate/tricarballylate:H+ symporter-like MFS transporter
MTTMTGSDRREKIWSVIRVSSGNFLEMYDFFVFGYYATAIGRTFFPTGSEFAQLMSEPSRSPSFPAMQR